MTRRAWLLWLAWFLMLAMEAASLWCADPSVLPADTPVPPARGAIAASLAALEARHWPDVVLAIAMRPASPWSV